MALLATLSMLYPCSIFFNYENLYALESGLAYLLHCIKLFPFAVGDFHFIFGLTQYTTYEDCVKEASMLVGKCRGISNHSQLEIDISNICDIYAEQLKNLCSANCAKG